MSPLVWAELRRLRPLGAAALGCAGLSAGLGSCGVDPGLADLLATAALWALGAWLAHVAFPGDGPRERHLAALPLAPLRLGGLRLGLAVALVAAAAGACGVGAWGWSAVSGGDVSASAALGAAGLAAWRLSVGCGVMAWWAPWPRLGSLALGLLALIVVGLRLLGAPPGLDPSLPANPVWLLPAVVGLGVAALRPRRGGVLAACERALTQVRLLDACWRTTWTLIVLGVALGAVPLVARERRAPRFPDPTTSIRTRHYQLVGARSQVAAGRALIDDADALYRRALGLLGGSQEERPRLRVTIVDEASAADQVGLAAGLERARLRLATLTARALVVDQTGRSEGVLTAGLARYVAWRVADVDPFWSRFQLAAAHATRPLTLDELLDPGQLARTRGLQLEAPAGELLVALWVDARGDAALGQLLSLARATPPRVPLTPRLEPAGFDLAATYAALTEVLEVDVPLDPRAQLRLPRLRVLEDMSDMPGLRFVAVPDSDLPPGWTIVAQVAFGRRGTPQPARRAGRLRGGVHAFAHPAQRGMPRIQVGLEPLVREPFQETLWEEWVQRR